MHHLGPRIPNYRLQRAHDENPIFQAAPVMTIRKGVRALGLTLYDEQRRRLVRFKDLRRTQKLELPVDLILRVHSSRLVG